MFQYSSSLGHHPTSATAGGGHVRSLSRDSHRPHSSLESNAAHHRAFTGPSSSLASSADASLGSTRRAKLFFTNELPKQGRERGGQSGSLSSDNRFGGGSKSDSLRGQLELLQTGYESSTKQVCQ